MIFMLIVVLFWFAQYVYIPYQTTFLTAIGVSSNFAGLVIGAYGLSQMLLRLPVGIKADTSGRHKRFILAGALFSGIASLFRVFFPGGGGYLTANLFSGLASSMWISFMVYYSNQFPPDQQHLATSRIIMYNNLGMLLGFITSTLFYEPFGMTAICSMSAGAGGLAFLLAFFLKEPESPRGAIPVRQLLSVCGGRRICIFSFLALIQQGIQLSTTMSFTAQILKQEGAGSILVGLSTIIYMLSAVFFSKLSSAKCGLKHGPRIWIPAVFMLVGCYCILVPYVHSIPLIFLLQLLPGMSTGILFCNLTSEAMKGIDPSKKSTAMGFYQAFYALGMTLFPGFTGAIVSASTIGIAYLVLAGIAVVGCGIAVWFYKRADGFLI